MTSPKCWLHERDEYLARSYDVRFPTLLISRWLLYLLGMFWLQVIESLTNGG